MVDLKSILYLHPLRAISSVGSEHLVYTEGVGGSNPSLPTSNTILLNFDRIFCFKKSQSLLYAFLKTKNTCTQCIGLHLQERFQLGIYNLFFLKISFDFHVISILWRDPKQELAHQIKKVTLSNSK